MVSHQSTALDFVLCSGRLRFSVVVSPYRAVVACERRQRGRLLRRINCGINYLPASAAAVVVAAVAAVVSAAAAEDARSS